ncbi:MarR family winged helix-turn-helix transcriptional regulator [Corynebacterium ulceribovis]|uniref:MarR family winged helix-turn-helix transcriptional regulator n=1 Tax=Corynebacterium ulceribovis TaxID=487732 RepID=UPI00036E5970|nr:MarR family winged helix-turn-helix transcriptional regulator [Corynebacterium ulceribovis]
MAIPLPTPRNYDDDTAQQAEARGIAHALYDFLAATRRLGERPNQKVHISQSEMEVLHFVATHPGCGVSDIARLRFLRPSNVSATVRKLIDEDLILRRDNPTDRRAQDLYVTEAGEEIIGKMVDYWSNIVFKVVGSMEKNEIKALRRAVPALLKLADHGEAYVEEIQRRKSAM